MGNHEFVDISRILDEIFDAAEDFKNMFANEMGFGKRFMWSNQRDYYPAYSYPPVNVYLTDDRSLVFEFALAGFAEEDIDLVFKGDYMVFSAKVAEKPEPAGNVKYFKKRLKLKNVVDQRYYVPADKFDQEQVKATLKQAILTVTVPAKDAPTAEPGMKITIEKDEAESKEQTAKKPSGSGTK